MLLIQSIYFSAKTTPHLLNGLVEVTVDTDDAHPSHTAILQDVDDKETTDLILQPANTIPTMSSPSTDHSTLEMSRTSHESPSTTVTTRQYRETILVEKSPEEVEIEITVPQQWQKSIINSIETESESDISEWEARTSRKLRFDTPHDGTASNVIISYESMTETESEASEEVRQLLKDVVGSPVGKNQQPTKGKRKKARMEFEIPIETLHEDSVSKAQDDLLTETESEAETKENITSPKRKKCGIQYQETLICDQPKRSEIVHVFQSSNNTDGMNDKAKSDIVVSEVRATTDYVIKQKTVSINDVASSPVRQVLVEFPPTDSEAEHSETERTSYRKYVRKTSETEVIRTKETTIEEVTDQSTYSDTEIIHFQHPPKKKRRTASLPTVSHQIPVQHYATKHSQPVILEVPTEELFPKNTVNVPKSERRTDSVTTLITAVPAITVDSVVKKDVTSQEISTFVDDIESHENQFSSVSLAEPKPPHFVEPIQPQVVTVGDTCVFRGYLEGSPTPSATWYWDKVKPGGEDYKGGKIKIPGTFRMHTLFEEENGVCMLILEDITEDDACNVSCVATNVAGQATCTANLVVVRK